MGVWDFVTGLLSWRLWAFLGLQDIRQRYRRSAFGPLWLAAGLGVTILGIGILYSQILKTPADTYIPFLAISLLGWTLISTVLLESTSLFQSGAGMITTMKVPYTSFVLRCIVRNFIVMAHCAVPVVIAFAFYKRPIGLVALWAIPGLLLLVANTYWMSLLIAIVCLRFRDVAQIVIYTIQIMLFLTPILWLPTSVRANNPALLYNPLYHLLAIFRVPIFQNVVPWGDFAYSLGILVVGATVAGVVFILNRRKLVYWL
ncbi:MAG: ABC transporter permease [Caulobacteraceae bacterium]|nr:ABC transporter permease [Caulobacter sp.]